MHKLIERSEVVHIMYIEKWREGGGMGGDMGGGGVAFTTDR